MKVHVADRVDHADRPSRSRMVPPFRSRSLRAKSGASGAVSAPLGAGSSLEKENNPLPR